MNVHTSRSSRDVATRVRLELYALDAIKAGLDATPELLHDPEALLALADGETDLLEAIDLLLRSDLEDRALLSSLELALRDLRARQERLEARSEMRRALLEQTMMLLECKRLERPLATISLVTRPPSLIVMDEALVPATFFKTKPVLDRKALKEALDRGETPPGAHLSNGLMSLTIRRQ